MHVDATHAYKLYIVTAKSTLSQERMYAMTNRKDKLLSYYRRYAASGYSRRQSDIRLPSEVGVALVSEHPYTSAHPRNEDYNVTAHVHLAATTAAILAL
jgi:hypothetical protein